MPTYEYKCDACGHAFEKFQTMSAEPVKVCPNCGKEQVRRLIGIGSGMIFKGSGFYITDYRDAAYKDKAKADAPAAAAASADTAKTADGSKDPKTPAAPAAPAAAATSSPAPSSTAPAAKPAPSSSSTSHD